MTNKDDLIRKIFLAVYVAISIATFYHSAWGFALLAGHPPQGWALLGWWFIGGAQAAAIDIGMGAIVYAMLHGWERGWLVLSLFLLAAFSAYSQLVYSTAHAIAYPLGEVPGWLQWLAYVLDARTVLFPLALPGFALIYAFAAKGEFASVQVQTDEVATPAQDIAIAKVVQAEPVARLQDAMQAAKPQPQADAKLSTAQRRKEVAKALRIDATVSDAKLAEQFAVDPSTIYRDRKAIASLNGAH